ncbi:Mu transposase C-terminal domain-containing protein [Paraburkholderia sp. J7]|uniref:Mu transposase C-terminal domain-containing protein n=1 Tax=Paraburkholderia sp. J7 TaxID=2805438 RepID=UPI002AB6D486|nr:Mu transposase C-terminal domain-containing protein [Paraburkholderia sp. J7]
MANFRKEQIVFRGEGKYRLIRTQNGVAQLENVETGEYSSHNEADLLEEYVRGFLRTADSKEYRRPPNNNAISDSLEAGASQYADNQGDAETRRRANYLVMLERLGAFGTSRYELRRAIRRVATDLDDPKPPHETTIYRWRRRYRIAQCDIRALLDKTDGRGGKDQSRLDPTVEAIIHERIETAFLNSKRGTAEDVYNAVFLDIQQINTTRIESEWLEVPGLRTIQRRIERIPAFDRALARYGEREAQRRFADQFRARRVSRILELVEIDHTKLDVMYTDASGRTIDRPTITVVFDRFSRCVLGFCISSAGHGVHAVFEALRHAMMPKSYLRERFPELSLEWPCHGWFERLLMDNGREFHAHAVVDALMNLGVICEYAASRDPNDKPFVERFLRTLNYYFVHKLPGTTLAKVHQRIGFKAEDEACLTFDKLNEMVHVWITMVYHMRPHRGLSKRTPLDVWKESASANPPQLKCNADDLSIEFSEYDERTLQHYGIDFDGFCYVSPELLTLRRMLPVNAKVKIKAPYENVGFIWVWDEIEEEYIAAYNTNDQYENLTREQAKLFKEMSKVSDPNRRTRAHGEQVIRDSSNEAMRSKKLSERRRGARQGHLTTKPHNRSQPVGGLSEMLPSTSPLTSESDEIPVFEIDSVNEEVGHEK